MKRLLTVLLLSLATPVMAADSLTLVVVSPTGTTLAPKITGYLATAETIDHATIALGLASAELDPGDTLYIHSGSYAETIAEAAWVDNSIVVYAANDRTAEIRKTTDGGTVVICPDGVGGGAADISGVKILNLRIEGAAPTTTNTGVRIAGARDFTLYNCVLEGTLTNVFQSGAGLAGHLCKTTTVRACSLSTTVTANYSAGDGPIKLSYSTDGNWGWDAGVIAANTFDFASANLGGANAFSILMESFTNSRFDSNTVYLAENVSASAVQGVVLRGNATGPSLSDSCQIVGNKIVGQINSGAGNIIMLGIGRNVATIADISDNILVADNSVFQPFNATKSAYGINVEAGFANGGNLNDPNGLYDHITIKNNIVEGVKVAYGLKENTRNSIMTGNVAIYGDSTVGGSDAYVLEASRWCQVTNNYAFGFQRGIDVEVNELGDIAWMQFRNSITGNTLQSCAAAIWIITGEGGSDRAVDSLNVYGGNIAVNCSAWAAIVTTAGGTTYRTLPYWRNTYRPSGFPAAGSDLAFAHGQGDEIYANRPGPIRASKAIPWGIFRNLGAGAGIKR